MASSGISINISAVDHATKQIEAVNKSLERLKAPAEHLQKQMAKFADVSGLKRVGEGFHDIGNRALEASRRMADIVRPLNVITGIASIADMVELAAAWGEFGERLGFASQRIGIGVPQLNALQGAARLAGGSAEALTSGMRS
jgi:hypothetical protein